MFCMDFLRGENEIVEKNNPHQGSADIECDIPILTTAT